MGFQFNESPRDRMTNVFRDIDRGVVGAQDRLVELVLPDVRRLANCQLDATSFKATGRPTDVVHETFTRLFDAETLTPSDRRHSYRAASEAMRCVVLERARAAQVRAQRDADYAQRQVSGLPTSRRLEMLLAMDELFERLRDIAPRQHEIVAASYFAEILDRTFLPGRGDPGLFELLTGGLLLIERCPEAALPQILSGLDVRFLAELGLLPPLLGCARCGADLDAGPLRLAADHPGLLCPRHARDGAPDVAPAALRWLDELRRQPSRTWGEMPPPPPVARRMLGQWIARAIERRPRLRAAARRSCRRCPAGQRAMTAVFHAGPTGRYARRARTCRSRQRWSADGPSIAGT